MSAAKGYHRHIGDVEEGYKFTSPEQFLDDFRRDADRWS
jgi:hypothetical protein